MDWPNPNKTPAYDRSRDVAYWWGLEKSNSGFFLCVEGSKRFARCGRGMYYDTEHIHCAVIVSLISSPSKSCSGQDDAIPVYIHTSTLLLGYRQ